MPGYASILCCTDLSHNSELAFKEAHHLASLTGARLVLLHVIHSAVGEAALAIPAAQREAEAEEALQRLKETYGKDGAEFEIVVRIGDVMSEIRDFADEMRADLIVVGARGVGRLEGFLGGGSIAEHIVRKTHVSILVVAAQQREAKRAHTTATDAGELPLIVKEVREAHDREEAAGGRD